MSRSSLILASYGRSHSSDCAGDEKAVMSHRLGAVEKRARLTVEATPDLEAVLAHYGKEAEA